MNKIIVWRNKFLEPNYKLTFAEKILGWCCFLGFGIIISLPFFYTRVIGMNYELCDFNKGLLWGVSYSIMLIVLFKGVAP